MKPKQLIFNEEKWKKERERLLENVDESRNHAELAQATLDNEVEKLRRHDDIMSYIIQTEKTPQGRKVNTGKSETPPPGLVDGDFATPPKKASGKKKDGRKKRGVNVTDTYIKWIVAYCKGSKHTTKSTAISRGLLYQDMLRAFPHLANTRSGISGSVGSVLNRIRDGVIKNSTIKQEKIGSRVYVWVPR